MHTFQVIFIVAVVCFVASECSFFKDCGSKKASGVKINISGCPDSMNPCKLHKGQNADVTVTFTATAAVKTLKTIVHGIIAGIPIPFPIDKPDACQYGNLTCPLVANKKYYYHSQIPIKSEYPSIELEVKWELQDENEEDVVCVEIPAEVESVSTRKHVGNPHIVEQSSKPKRVLLYQSNKPYWRFI